MELWLKHYLNLFFDFKSFGNLNWLAIPLFIYFVMTIKKRKRWEIALAFVFMLSYLALAVKALGVPRYLFTLYPFTLVTIFLYGWELIKKKSHSFQIGIFIICTLAVFFNYYHSREAYRSIWRYKVSVVNDYFPHELIKYINIAEDFDSNSTTLVCSHRHYFFYYTDKRAIYYQDPKLGVFYIRQNKEEALNILKNQFRVKYIFLVRNFKTIFLATTGLLYDIITNDCDLIRQDKNGYYLYKLRDKDLTKEELEKLFINDSLLKNGSFESWSAGASRNPDFFQVEIITREDYPIREEKEVKIGKYSAKITGDNFNFSQYLSNFKDYKDKNISCFVWVKTKVPNKFRIEIYDGIKSSYSKRHWGGGNWELLQATHEIDPSAEFVKVRVIQAANTGGVDDVVYVDGALLVEGYWNTFYQYELHLGKGR